MHCRGKVTARIKLKVDFKQIEGLSSNHSNVFVQLLQIKVISNNIKSIPVWTPNLNFPLTLCFVVGNSGLCLDVTEYICNELIQNSTLTWHHYCQNFFHICWDSSQTLCRKFGKTDSVIDTTSQAYQRSIRLAGNITRMRASITEIRKISISQVLHHFDNSKRSVQTLKWRICIFIWTRLPWSNC